MPKIKNIIIFIIIAVVFVLIYIYFIKPSTKKATLVSSTPASATQPTNNTATSASVKTNSAVSKEFLDLLLSVKSIKLDDSLFTNPSFISISKHDSSIILIPDGNEGRINPFSPIGSDTTAPITCILTQVLNPVTNTCVNAAAN